MAVDLKVCTLPSSVKIQNNIESQKNKNTQKKRWQIKYEPDVPAGLSTWSVF